MTLSWHQMNAIRRDQRMKHVKSHVVDEKVYGFVSLCGERVPSVTVDAEHAHKAHNNACPKCFKILEKNRENERARKTNHSPSVDVSDDQSE